MSGLVKLATLENIARRHGRPPSTVRIAVSKNLIRKAERHGKGRGKGCEWLYPPGTDRAFKLLFRLQKNGYRGDALRFALWWEDAAPFSAAVSEYVASTLDAPGKDIRTRVAGKVKRDESAVYEDDTYNEDGDSDIETFPNVLRDWLDRALKPSVLQFLFDVLKEINPTTTLRVKQVSQLVRVFVATTMRIWPEDIGATAFPFMAAYLLSEGPHDPKMRELTVKLAEWFHYKEFFDELVDYARTAKPGGYEKGLLLLRDDPALSKIISVTTLAAKQMMKAKSEREFRRAGPWQFPELAVRATAIGVLVGTTEWVQANARTDGAPVAAEPTATGAGEPGNVQ